MATYALTVAGDRLVPVVEEEARRITALWDEVRLENEGKTLVEVNLGCRSYRPDGAQVIADYLTPELVKDVKTARLDDMIAGLEGTKAFGILTVLCDCFRDCELTFVDLSENALGSKGLEACDSVLSQQKKLEELYLCDNGIAQESMETLKSQLPVNLKTLHFFNNMVGSEGAEHFAEILRSCKRLENVRYAQVRAGVSGSLAVIRALDENTDLVLKKLDIDGASLEGKGLEHLCAILRRSTKLTYLNVGDCDLEQDGMVEVCNALMNCEPKPRLEFLNLSENISEEEDDDDKPITPTCCNAIASLLHAQRESLRIFKCETNFLTSYGAERMMEVFNIENAPLEELYLSENKFGHRAAVALERALLPNLRILKLNGNGFMLRDVTRLEEAFGEALEEMEDNEEDSNFDLELVDEGDEELEEELAVANAAPQRDQDDLEDLSQFLSQQHI